MSTKEKYEQAKLPMVPIRDVVIFPFMMVPFVIGRESSVLALEAALRADKRIFLATQHDATADNPRPNEIYQVGTISTIVQSLKLPDGKTRVDRDFQSYRTLQAPGRCSGYRNRKASCGPLRAKSRQAPDGTRAERVLSQRKDQGDSARTGQERRKIGN